MKTLRLLFCQALASCSFLFAQPTPVNGGSGGGGEVSDTAYNASTWDGVTTIAPSKNAIRDKIETIRTGSIVVTIGDGVNVITTGEKITARLVIPDSCTLTGWTIITDTSTTTTVDVWKDVYANYPATDGDSITNGHEINVTAGLKATDADISDWTSVTVTAGDQLAFAVDANNNAKWIKIVITFTR